MFDILINGELITVCAKGVLSLYLDTLIKHLEPDFTLTVKHHEEVKPEAPVAEEPKAKK